jgi:putative ABC transport system substrate-binding protein
VIFAKGDPGTGLMGILAGAVKISVSSAEGREIVLTTLCEGDIFGEIALLDGHPRTADAESDAAAQSWVAAFRGALAKLGWTEGGNLQIELRWGAGNADKIGTLAKELVDLRPDAILSQTTLATGALARETRTVPIVFVNVADPVASGFAASLARPGGNVTGFALLESTVGGKWVGLLKEIAPHTARMALLFNPATAVLPQLYISSIQAAASSFAVQASTNPVHAKDEIEEVIAAQARNPGGSLIVMLDPFNLVNRELIIALAGRYGVPTIYNAPFFVQTGGLIAYGPDRGEQFRQAAGYIDRILKGEKPADLPVQTPVKFELVVNLKTAKALSLTVPTSLLVGRRRGD